MRIVITDGGRKAAGFKGKAGDCVCRSIAIVTGLPYQQVYDRLAHGNGSQRASKRTPKRGVTASNGINTNRKWFDDYMAELGFVWTPTMHIGAGTTMHLTYEEIPDLPLFVARISRSLVTVVNGVVQDIADPSRDGTRAVYGYFRPHF